MDNSQDVLEQEPKVRRYDIDWLRVIVFGLLILFHVAVGFVAFDVYAYQNNQTGGSVLELLLLFIHQWRLPALFIISGMGTAYAFRRRTGWQFIYERTKRLLIPLIFAMNFVVIFQGYYAAQHYGKAGSLLDFAFRWWSHLGEAQHLWFLINLFIYSLICIPLFVHVKNRPDGSIMKLFMKILQIPKGLGLLFIVPVPLIIVEFLVKPWTFGITGMGYEFPWYLVFFIIGYLCIASKEIYWNALDKIRYNSLVLGVLSFLLLFMLMALGNYFSPGYGNLTMSGGWIWFGDTFWGFLTLPSMILHALNAWFWCVAIFSWGAKYLNKPSRKLTYLNQAVYTFYIVHMTFCLIALYYLKDIVLYWPVKFVIITAITIAGCWATFEIVKRNKITRMLFGIKPISAVINNYKKMK